MFNGQVDPDVLSNTSSGDSNDSKLNASRYCALSYVPQICTSLRNDVLLSVVASPRLVVSTGLILNGTRGEPSSWIEYGHEHPASLTIANPVHHRRLFAKYSSPFASWS